MYFCREPNLRTNRGLLLNLFSKHLGRWVILIYMLLSGGLLTLWVLPQWAQIAKLKKEIAIIELNRGPPENVRAKVVGDYRAIEVPTSTQDELGDVNLFQRDISSFLKEISQKATACGMTIQNFTTLSPKEDKGVVAYPLEISLEGSYPKIMEFLSEVINLREMHNIEEISIERDIQTEQAASTNLRLVLITSNYRILNKEEVSDSQEVAPLKPFYVSEMIPILEKTELLKNT